MITKIAKNATIKISKFRFLQNGMGPMKTAGGTPPDGQTPDRHTDGRKKRSLHAPPFSMGGIDRRPVARSHSRAMGLLF